MNRLRLKGRRPNVTSRLEHHGQVVHVTVGFHDDGRPMEVFGSAKKASTDLDFMVADACVAISIALQHGITASDLLHSMHWVPVFGNPEVTREPASIVGKLVQLVMIEEIRIKEGSASADP